METPESATQLLIMLKKIESPSTRHGERYTYHFHILKSIRDFYSIDKILFQITGNVIFANFYQARTLADRMNKKRDTLRFPETAVKAGHINAMGLIDEILHYVIGLYKEQEAPSVFSTALGYLENKFDSSEIDRLIQTFRELYPAPDINNQAEKEVILEEIILLWFANTNPAFEPFIELFDHTELKETTIYAQVMDELYTFFDTQPYFGPKNQNLIDMLKTPALLHPSSLSGQISYMQKEWGMLLGKYLLRLLQSMDFIREEERPFLTGPGPTHVYTYEDEAEDPERFSQDKEWMPKVVLLAKSIYVWLHQLSTKYERTIKKLDAIPEEELNCIASRGFTGLWLIGIWERSPASKRIKQICGNMEAEASAYSLMEYEIAQDLGGWDALHRLKNRCLKRGVRLASDMVPNHTGIDSKWVINHPDWFIQLSQPPYPQYSFNGENLSHDERVHIYIEDHYYDKSDAAVAFKRLDTHTGDARYIYHGNDGTSMPWNDTAQLDFLKPEVREAVIQTILHVARNFPVIRFDAAMTLAKKHFQRLWYPVPGSGGDIPTRAEHGLTKEEFNRAIPVEFWREVVDRVFEEVPDTLLLAEAFWMMEGYFVRTLGMHRVYNSAFMNMLKNEENEKYRNTIKNTQEFDPDILKRFVNFMNNPDEETATAQFGTDDKYFGVCTLMITMPGLPMFGHGQIEGFTEKYGMEYSRSYWEEKENVGLIERHEREIFPLVRKRYLFADANHFLLYDVFTTTGSVNENVFAYSNRCGDEIALVLYNNAFSRAEGWINMSAAFAQKLEDGSKQLAQKSLAQGINVPANSQAFVIFQEHRTKEWYIRNCKEIWDKGIYLSLEGYETHVFLQFHVVYDNEYGHYNQLATFLNGKGTEDIQRSLQEVFLSPLHSKFLEIINEKVIGEFHTFITGETDSPVSQFNVWRQQLVEHYASFFEEVEVFVPNAGHKENVQEKQQRLQQWLDVAYAVGKTLYYVRDDYAATSLKKYPTTLYTVLTLPFYLSLSENNNCAGLVDQLLLEKPISDILRHGIPKDSIRTCVTINKLLTCIEPELERYSLKKPAELMTALFKYSEISRFLGENRYNDILYFNKESLETLLWYTAVFSTMVAELSGSKKDNLEKALHKNYTAAKKVLSAAKNSGYQTELFIEKCKKM